MFQFQGFTEKANKALNLAVQSAEQFGHSYVGTEHVLLGLLQEGSGVAYAALTSRRQTATYDRSGIGRKIRAAHRPTLLARTHSHRAPSVCCVRRWRFAARSAAAMSAPSTC